MFTSLRTGDIIIINVENNIGSQQGGIRPAIIVSNNIGNKHSNTIKVLPGTTKRNNSTLPTHVHFSTSEVTCLSRDTTFEAESSWVINKFQIIKKIGTLTETQLNRVAIAMAYDTPLVLLAFQNNIQNTETFQKISR